MIRFDQTPPPAPSWDRHLSTEARLELALREGRPAVIQQRDTGDEMEESYAEQKRKEMSEEWVRRVVFSDEQDDGAESLQDRYPMRPPHVDLAKAAELYDQMAALRPPMHCIITGIADPQDDGLEVMD